MINVALQSVQRFHPTAGYFVLLPSEHACNEYPCAAERREGDIWCGHHFRRMCPLLELWSRGTVRPLSLSREVEQLFATNASAANSSSGNASAFIYSRMTFLRHFVPQRLASMGYQYSVNLDPDTFCVRSWDLRLLLRIQLIGGRPVGSNVRTERFLQLGGQSAYGNTTDALQRALNVSRERLGRRTELNGGVLVFNNTEAARVGWGQVVARSYNRLQNFVESDQDLVSLILDAEPSFGRHLLPTIYNYAFRRDRERLPYAVSHRLRHGLIGHFKSVGTRGEVVMLHFVQDGKPWERQELASYPPWLLAVRLFHVANWQNLARKVKPELFNDHVRLGLAETRMLGGAATGALQQGRRNKAKALSSIVDAESFRRCRCFVRGLARDAKANISSDVGRRQSRLQLSARSNASVVGAVSSREANAASRSWQALLEACCSDRCANTASSACKCSESQLSNPEGEATQCNAERGANSKRFNCRLAAQRSGDGESWAPSNCTTGAVSFGASGVAAVGQMAMRSRIFYCRECLALSPPVVWVTSVSPVAVQATREARRGASSKRAKLQGCRISARRAGGGESWASSNCSTGNVSFGVSDIASVGQLAMRSRTYFCRECLTLSPPVMWVPRTRARSRAALTPRSATTASSPPPPAAAPTSPSMAPHAPPRTTVNTTSNTSLRSPTPSASLTLTSSMHYGATRACRLHARL